MVDQKEVALILSKTKLYNNHPVPNQLFLDIFPLFRSPQLTEIIISHLCSYITKTYPDLHHSISAIVCLEARGFFFAPIIALKLGLPVVPVRKKGKLPGECVHVEYIKEYGADEFEMKSDAFEGIETGGKKVLLMDDLLGTGGSIMAAKEASYLYFFLSDKLVILEYVQTGIVLTESPQLCEKLHVKVAEALFIFDCDGVPAYKQAVDKKLGDLKRYTMITLSPDNVGACIN